MTDTTPSHAPRHRAKFGAAAAALLAIGAGVGGFAGHAFRPAIVMAPIHPVAIRSLTDGTGIVTIKGRVAERYGNQFVLADGTGKALIDAGPAAEDSTLAPTGSVVSVQGRFERGTLRPSFLVDPSGTVVAIGHEGPGHPGLDHGPHSEKGDQKDPEARPEGAPLVRPAPGQQGSAADPAPR